MSLLAVLTNNKVRIFEFQKSKMTDILTTVTSPYLRNRLTDYDEIWHVDTPSPRPLKFRIFKNPRWRRTPS